MIEQELFLEWVDNTINTYEDAPSEVKNGYITMSISMLKEIRELTDKQQEEIYELKLEIGRLTDLYE